MKTSTPAPIIYAQNTAQNPYDAGKAQRAYEIDLGRDVVFYERNKGMSTSEAAVKIGITIPFALQCQKRYRESLKKSDWRETRDVYF